MEKIKFRSNQITLLGDTHDITTAHTIIQGRLDNGSDVVHLGDVGLGFGDVKYSVDNARYNLEHLNDVCMNKDINCVLIRGNHDATYPSIWGEKFSNITMVGGHAYGTFPNCKQALLLAGGISIDRCARRPNIDYWGDEGTDPIDDVERCDMVFSHDAPEEFNHSSDTIPTHWIRFAERDDTLHEDCVEQRRIVGDIVKRTQADSIFYGHFHNRRIQMVNGVYGQCVEINETVTFDADKLYAR